MPKKKEYSFKQRILIKESIDAILEIIKDNNNIKLQTLLAKIHVDPPYISKDKALYILRDLKRAGKIKYEDDNISLI